MINVALSQQLQITHTHSIEFTLSESISLLYDRDKGDWWLYMAEIEDVVSIEDDGLLIDFEDYQQVSSQCPLSKESFMQYKEVVQENKF